MALELADDGTAMTEDAAAAAAIDKGVSIEDGPADDVLEEVVIENSVLEERCMS